MHVYIKFVLIIIILMFGVMEMSNIHYRKDGNQCSRA